MEGTGRAYLECTLSAASWPRVEDSGDKLWGYYQNEQISFFFFKGLIQKDCVSDDGLVEKFEAQLKEYHRRLGEANAARLLGER